MVCDKQLSNFDVNIPAAYVEVDGAIKYDDIAGLKNVKDLVYLAVGKFTDPALKPCRILEAEPITRPIAGNIDAREATNTVRVTFEGTVVPNYIAIDNFIIRAPPFLKWPMFCETCLLWGHTNKRCRRKAKCARCGGEHKEDACTNPAANKTICPFCTQIHPKGMVNCPYMKKVAKDHMRKQNADQRAKYQRMVREVHGHPVDIKRPRVPPVLNEANFPAVSNRFSALSVENETAVDNPAVIPDTPSYAFPPPPKNPYVPRQRSISRRSASKRRRDGSVSVNSRHSNIQQQAGSSQASRDRSATISLQQPNIRASTIALRMLILSIARNCGISATWAAVLEAVIDPLIQLILPHVEAITAAVAPHLTASNISQA